MVAHEGRVGEKVARGAVEGDAAVLEHDEAVGDLGERVGVVAGNDHGGAVLRCGAHGVEAGAAGARVEPGGRLVEQEQPRAQREHGGDRDAPLLAAGEREGRARAQLVQGKPHERERPRRPLVCLVAGDAAREQAEGNLALDRALEELPLGHLEHEPDPARALHAHAARVGARRAGHDLEQGRLAGPRPPHEAADAARESARDTSASAVTRSPAGPS